MLKVIVKIMPQLRNKHLYIKLREKHHEKTIHKKYYKQNSASPEINMAATINTQN